jgi:hypothetical protein
MYCLITRFSLWTLGTRAESPSDRGGCQVQTNCCRSRVSALNVRSVRNLTLTFAIADVSGFRNLTSSSVGGPVS